MLCDKVWGIVKRHATVPGVVIVFAATYVLMLAVHAGETGAAWIQAFGSIGAILAAAYIASEDRRVERAREKRKEAVICLALLYKVEEAKGVLWSLSISFRHEFNATCAIAKAQVDRCVALLDGQIQSLHTVDLTTLPDPRLVNALVEVIGHLEDARAITAEDLIAFIKLQSPRDPFEQHLAWVRECIGVIREFAEPGSGAG